MRAAGIVEYGGAVTPLTLPEPAVTGDDQVLIEIHAAGVGYWDELVRNGAWDIGAVPPMALGVEASGVVREVGHVVSRFRPGDHVLTHSVPIEQGMWAESLVAREAHIARKPPNMSLLEAALFPIPALTAHQVIWDALALKSGETVLVNGAGGLTGGLLVATAADTGAHVIATAGPQSVDQLRRYGASIIVDYHVPDWQAQVRVAANGDLPAAVNAARGHAGDLVGLVASGGRLATLTGDPPSSERGIHVTNFYVHPDGAALERMAERSVERGVSIPIARTCELSDAGSALAQVTSGHAKGGIAISVRGES